MNKFTFASDTYYMNFSALFIIPALVCLTWIFIHWFMASRLISFRIIVILLSFTVLTIMGDVVLIPLLGSPGIAHIVISFSSPTLIPLTCYYFHFLYKPFHYKPRHFFWMSFPVLLTTASIILTSIIGLKETDAFLGRVHSLSFNINDPINTELHHLYYYWCVVLFRVILWMEVMYLVGDIIYLSIKCRFRPRSLFRFLFKGDSIRVLQIQIYLAACIFLVILSKMRFHATVFHDYPYWGLLFSSLNSVLYFFFGFFALFSAKEYITLHDISTAFRFNYKPESRSALLEDIITDMSRYLNVESLMRVISRLTTQHGVSSGQGSSARADAGSSLSAAVLNVMSPSQDEHGLAAQFQQWMYHERPYLQPGFTLADVAERLHTNKTYVSKMVNQTYKMGFPELINILRVDHAQRYIRQHPDASQEEIAKASGFLNASAFNSTFKRITGFTPKVWTARKESAGR